MNIKTKISCRSCGGNDSKVLPGSDCGSEMVRMGEYYILLSALATLHSLQLKYFVFQQMVDDLFLALNEHPERIYL